MEAHELVGLGHTFPFFACLAVGHFSIDPWNQAGREGRSKLARRQASASLCLSNHPIDFESVFRWLGACWVRDAFHLLDQLQDFGSTRARGRLIRHRRNPLDESRLQKAADGHQHQADGAVAAGKCAEPARQAVADYGLIHRIEDDDRFVTHAQR